MYADDGGFPKRLTQVFQKSLFHASFKEEQTCGCHTSVPFLSEELCRQSPEEMCHPELFLLSCGKKKTAEIQSRDLGLLRFVYLPARVTVLRAINLAETCMILVLATGKYRLFH